MKTILHTSVIFALALALTSCGKQPAAAAKIVIGNEAPISSTLATITKDSSILIERINGTHLYTVRAISSTSSESLHKANDAISKIEEACKASNPPIEFHVVDPLQVYEVRKKIL